MGADRFADVHHGPAAPQLPSLASSSTFSQDVRWENSTLSIRLARNHNSSVSPCKCNIPNLEDSRMVTTMALNCMVDFPVGPWLLLSPDPQAKLTAKSG